MAATSPTPGTSVDLIFMLSTAARSLEIEMQAALAAIDSTPRSYCVLSKAIEGEFTQIELAKRCALDKTTMVVALDELERAGLAQRRPSPTDRRARVIAVTPAGAELVARGREVVEGVYADVLATLPDEERWAFTGGLVRLVEGRLAEPPECERPVRRRRGTP